MRWERLFDDLQGQFAAADSADLAGEVSERTRIEQSRVHLADRLRAGLGLPVTIGCGGEQLEGTLLRVTPNAVLLELTTGEAVVLLAAVTSVSGLGRAVAEPAGVVDSRSSVRQLLRAIAADRAPVQVRLTDGTDVTGTIDAVMADAVELAEHPLDEPRRAGAVRRHRLIPLWSLAVVRTG